MYGKFKASKMQITGAIPKPNECYKVVQPYWQKAANKNLSRLVFLVKFCQTTVCIYNSSWRGV